MPAILAIAAAVYLLAGLALVGGLCRAAASSDAALAAHRRRARTPARR
jgi:uncharacterized membrane protein YjjP (DUF1212 family)